MADMYFTGSGQILVPGLSAAANFCTLALKTATGGPRITLSKLGVFFIGTSTSAVPMPCQICRITNTPAGTAVPSDYGPNPLDDAAPASVALVSPYVLTASTANPGVWTTNPTPGAIIWEGVIPPTTGLPEYVPLGQEVKVSPNKWFGVFITAPASTALAAVGAYTSLVHTE